MENFRGRALRPPCGSFDDGARAHSAEEVEAAVQQAQKLESERRRALVAQAEAVKQARSDQAKFQWHRFKRVRDDKRYRTWRIHWAKRFKQTTTILKRANRDC